MRDTTSQCASIRITIISVLRRCSPSSANCLSCLCRAKNASRESHSDDSPCEPVQDSHLPWQAALTEKFKRAVVSLHCRRTTTPRAHLAPLDCHPPRKKAAHLWGVPDHLLLPCGPFLRQQRLLFTQELPLPHRRDQEAHTREHCDAHRRNDVGGEVVIARDDYGVRDVRADVDEL